jgi:ATP-binding cassette subfamily C (CFTR/MRP) protein 1
MNFRSGPVQIISILALLIYYIQYSALAGFALLVFAIPIQAIIFARLGMLRRKVAGISDTRIRSTQEYLQGMRIIKLFAWEDNFLAKLLTLRVKELTQIRFVNVWTAVLMGISTSIPILASVISFIVYALTNNALNPPIVFAALSLFNLMRFPLILLPNTIRSLVESRVGLNRLNDFLNAEELKDQNNLASKNIENGSEYAIEIKNATFQWETLPEDSASDQAKKSKTGKNDKNEVDKNNEADKEKKSQVDKQVMDDKAKNIESISQNHDDTSSKVFHLKDINVKIKKGKLIAVVGPVGSGKSSLLNALLSEMKKISGDMHICGSIGYSLQQPWIQNGSLRSNILFGNSFDEQKYQRAVEVTALARDLEWLPSGSDTLLGEKGVQISGKFYLFIKRKALMICRRTKGAYQSGAHSLLRSGRCAFRFVFQLDTELFPSFLDDPISAVDVHVGKHIFDHCIKNALHGKTIVLVTHHLSYLRNVDEILYMKDGKIIEQGTFEELMNLDGECARVVKTYSSDENHEQQNIIVVEDKKDTILKKEGKGTKMIEEERQIGSVSWKVYRNYVHAAGGWVTVGGCFMLAVVAQCARVGNDLWLVAWSNDYFSALSESEYAGIYFSWGISQGIAVAILGTSLAFSFALASKKFHQDAIDGVFKAPITFFDRTPLGRMMNRFSRDTDTMDATLPMSLQMFICKSLQV